MGIYGRLIAMGICGILITMTGGYALGSIFDINNIPFEGLNFWLVIIATTLLIAGGILIGKM